MILRTRASAAFAGIGAPVAFALCVWGLGALFGAAGFARADASALSFIVLAPVCVAAYAWHAPGSVLGAQVPPARSWLAIAAASCALSAATTCLAGVAGAADAAGVVAATPLAVVGMGLAAPIAEEAVFRGFSLARLESAFGRWPALIVNSLLFAAMHGSPLRMFFAVFAGVLFCTVQQRCRFVPATAFAHCVANLVPFAIVAL